MTTEKIINGNGIRVLEVQSWAEIPFGTTQIYNPSFRDMTTKQVIKASKVESEYVPYGYNIGFMCKSTATLHIMRGN